MSNIYYFNYFHPYESYEDIALLKIKRDDKKSETDFTYDHYIVVKDLYDKKRICPYVVRLEKNNENLYEEKSLMKKIWELKW